MTQHQGVEFRFTSRFANNAVIILDGSRSSDLRIGRAISETLRDLNDFAGHQRHIVTLRVESAAGLQAALHELAAQCQRGLRPILHVESHGEATRGLQVGDAREWISWQTLTPLFRAIDAASAGNLGVVMSACFGLHAVAPVKIAGSDAVLLPVGQRQRRQTGRAGPAYAGFLSGALHHREPGRRAAHCAGLELLSRRTVSGRSPGTLPSARLYGAWRNPAHRGDSDATTGGTRTAVAAGAAPGASRRQGACPIGIPPAICRLCAAIPAAPQLLVHGGRAGSVGAQRGLSRHRNDSTKKRTRKNNHLCKPRQR